MKVQYPLNSLEVVESQGGDDAYLLVANSPENRAKLNAVGVTDEQINGYGDEETFCLLALAFDLDFADEIDTDGKLAKWDLVTFRERAQIIIDAELIESNDYPSIYSVSVAQAYLNALDEIERLRQGLSFIRHIVDDPSYTIYGLRDEIDKIMTGGNAE